MQNGFYSSAVMLAVMASSGQKPLAVKTVREIVFLVASCFKKAVARELISKSPITDDCQIPEAEVKEALSLDEAQLAILLDTVAGTRLYPLIMLAAATGCRRGELLTLEWFDIDFDTGMLSVTKSLEDTEKKA